METPSILNAAYTSNTLNLNDFQNQGFLTTSAHTAPAKLDFGKIQIKAKEKVMSSRRLVKVMIVDTDRNVPVEKCLLYSGEEKFTDFTDQELFFDLEIKDILNKYNGYRVTVPNKELSTKMGKDIMLEPIRISQLSMVVVDIAKF